MIPDLVNGVLPEGIHSCTLEEVKEKFGRFQRTGQRITLTNNLFQLESMARRSKIVAALIIDGSYVTLKEEPNDIDVIVALRKDFVRTEEMSFLEYSMTSNKALKKTFKLDVFSLTDGSPQFQNLVGYFCRIRKEDQKKNGYPPLKGLLRIEL